MYVPALVITGAGWVKGRHAYYVFGAGLGKCTLHGMCSQTCNLYRILKLQVLPKDHSTSESQKVAVLGILCMDVAFHASP